MSKQNSRAAAIHILDQWQKSYSAIDPLIEKYTITMPEARDRQLVKAIVFGTLRHLKHLDYIIAIFSSHPLGKIKPIALQALRSALYQLLFMDRVPESAAINETIKALKAKKQPKWLTGFVNGVLRNICRSKDKVAALNDDLPLEAQCNHPQWLLERWQQRFGRQETINICQFNNQAAHLCLRINQSKTNRDDFLDLLQEHNFHASPGLAPASVWLNDSCAVDKLPGYKEGLFSVQDETAQLITGLLGPFTEGNYLDACAGLGGKTMAIAQLVPPGSAVWAVEPQKRRQELLRDNLNRLNLENVSLFNGTLEEFSQTATHKFQSILVDAPCSGLGVTGRHPDIRWNRKPADLPRFQKIQLEILHNAAELLATRGIIVYATCSMEPEENEEVVKKFLANHPRFKISNAASFLPDQTIKVDKQGYLHTRPSENIQDGFFAVRFTG